VLDLLLLLVDDVSSSVLDGVSVMREAVLEGDGVIGDAQVQEVAFKVLDGTPLEGPTGPVGVSTMVVPLGGLLYPLVADGLSIVVELDGPFDVAVALIREDVMELDVGIGGPVYEVDKTPEVVEFTTVGPVADWIGVDEPLPQKEDAVGAVPGNDEDPVVLLA
jgi:hypothetical protein